MGNRVMVLGAGMVGATMARDLATDPALTVTVADSSAPNLSKLADVPNLTVMQAELGTPERVREAVAGFDLVVGSMPGRLGLQTLRAIIEAGVSCCDISFMPENALELHELACARGVTAVVDCGVAPGLSNLIVGDHVARLDQTDRVEIHVGGLPRNPQWPYLHRASFSPADVIEEYTRPARLVENGQVVVKAALSDLELIDLPLVGTLEAFNTDGLRSLLHTVQARRMTEKTLRWPGHAELMRVLRETGFFAASALDVNGVEVRPLDVTSRLLFPAWQLGEGEPEFTVMRVVVEGRRGQKGVCCTYDLYDEYDPHSGATSMARTTGYTCTIVARMIASGRIRTPGVFAPEQIAQRDGILGDVLEQLGQKGVTIRSAVEEKCFPA